MCFHVVLDRQYRLTRIYFPPCSERALTTTSSYANPPGPSVLFQVPPSPPSLPSLFTQLRLTCFRPFLIVELLPLGYR